MYAKLNSEGNEVVLLRTKCVFAGFFEGPRGPRKVYRNTTETVTRWNISNGPDAYQVEMMGKDADGIMTWALKQDEAINQAFARNFEKKLAGGRPLIVGTKAHSKIADNELEDTYPDAKVGEFCGVIAGARSIANVISEPVIEKQKETIEEVEQQKPQMETTILLSMISDQLNEVSAGLLEAISNKVDSGEVVTCDEIYDIYESERQIYYILTRGLGVKVNEYETARRKEADRRFSNTKKGRFGMALRQAASIFESKQL